MRQRITERGGPAPKGASRPVRATQPEPSRAPVDLSHPGAMVGMQQRAGNRTVTRMLAVQRKGGEEVTKPKAGVLSDKRSLTRDLESAVGKNDQPAVEAAEAALFSADPGYLAELLIYKLTKHKGDRDKQMRYTLGAPEGVGVPALDLAFRRANTEAVAFWAVARWKDNEAACRNLALRHPELFIDTFILDGLRRENTGKLVIKSLVESDKDFLGNLATAAPAAYGRLVAAVPLLNLVSGVQAGVEADGRAGNHVSEMGVVDRLFDAFVGNHGMELAYAGTAMDQNDIILTGMTATDRKLREAKNAITTMPKELSTACHQILGLFRSVLAGYPGLEGLDVRSGDEPGAVLTQPLGTLPGGLIHNDYTGNVFDAAGRATGQIFFSGNREVPANSHSWVVINKVPYDPVLGTRGPAVKAAMNGIFEFTDGPNRAVEKGGRGRVLTRAEHLKTSGAYGITAAWQLS